MTNEPVAPNIADDLKALLDEAVELENDHLPQVRPTTVSQPNLTKSEVLHVRVSEQDHRDLTDVAADLNVPVSDVVRAALHRFLHESDESREVAYLLQALHESGLSITRSAGSAGHPGAS
jgi:hypothetical protein